MPVSYKKLPLEERIEYCNKMFEEQKGMIQSQLRPGEKMAHCVDETSFHGERYYPLLVNTSSGRVWNLTDGHWIDVKLETKNKKKPSNHRYHIVGAPNYFPEINPSKRGTIRTHLLVANYFGDKGPIYDFARKYNIPIEDAEAAFRINHIVPHDESLSNEENNNAANLQFIHDSRKVKERIQRYNITSILSQKILTGFKSAHAWLHRLLKGTFGKRKNWNETYVENDHLGQIFVKNLNEHFVKGLRLDEVWFDGSGEVFDVVMTARLKANGSDPDYPESFYLPKIHQLKEELAVEADEKERLKLEKRIQNLETNYVKQKAMLESWQKG